MTVGKQPSVHTIAPGAPIPKRWMTPLGPIRVICEPVEGYVMARRPQCAPFVLSVRDLLGSGRRTHHLGPFEPIAPATRRKANAVRNEPNKDNVDRGPA